MKSSELLNFVLENDVVVIKFDLSNITFYNVIANKNGQKGIMNKVKYENETQDANTIKIIHVNELSQQQKKQLSNTILENIY